MKFKPTESISAAELMNRLKSDPAWVQQNAEREAKHQASVAKLRTELGPEVTPLLAELATVGIHVACVSELINAKWSYAAAVPVLSKHLQKGCISPASARFAVHKRTFLLRSGKFCTASDQLQSMCSYY